jgi:hypothetical protein
LKRAVLLLVCSAALLLIVSCSGSGNSVTGPNGNVTVNAPSQLKNRAFITNQFSGNIQIVDSQNDTTAYYNVTNNNTGNSTNATPTSGGTPSTAVNIVVGGSLSWELLSPDDLETLVYNPQSNTLTFITNSSEVTNGTVSLGGRAPMGVYSADSKNIYVPEPAALLTTGSRPGVVQFISSATGTVSNSIPVPSAQSLAISPDGNTLLVFAANSDTMYFVNPTATSPTAIAIPGFARPVSAFFSSDSTTAYILNCGPECGSTAGPPSVMKFDVASKTITATVPVGGATVGLLKNTTLYVAGYPGGATGTFDVVDVGSMTRSTSNPIVIGDGTHTTMAISNNNKLYIGAVTCANVTAGCLSIMDLGKVAADPQPTPLGAVTAMQSIPNRDVMYVIQGGVLNIYDTSTGQLQSTQIAFRGALYSVVQVDQ